MAEFLSDAWLDELADAAHSAGRIAEDVRLVIQQVVVDDDDHELAAYAISVDSGQVTVAPGRAVAADVTFTQDRSTAVAIARGDLSAQAAFLAGRLRVGGDLRAALEQARGMAAVVDVFGSVRSTTTW